MTCMLRSGAAHDTVVLTSYQNSSSCVRTAPFDRNVQKAHAHLHSRRSRTVCSCRRLASRHRVRTRRSRVAPPVRASRTCQAHGGRRLRVHARAACPHTSKAHAAPRLVRAPSSGMRIIILVAFTSRLWPWVSFRRGRRRSVRGDRTPSTIRC